MEYLTDQKLSVKGIDGYTSGIDAPRMKMRTSWGSLKDYYDIVVWNSPRARQDHWKGLAQQSFEKTDALEKLLYDRFTYGFSNTGVTSSSAFITNQSQEEASLDGTFRMLSLGGSGECIRRRQATSTLDDHGTGYHPVVMDTGISPTYSIPRLSQEENPYLNSNVNLNTDMEFVVETQVESEKAMWI
ncbi:uncharacterized protein LOC113308311 [Papaver somniferum]|uniref:uncharacterized protein LOC113308311 n=1 Tax=Papaver somniferum TaxID=3469 RepID=UPI000E7006BB|nr:uncharacterized protein LOC113308311 [Papaver somniferum]